MYKTFLHTFCVCCYLVILLSCLSSTLGTADRRSGVCAGIWSILAADTGSLRFWPVRGAISGIALGIVVTCDVEDDRCWLYWQVWNALGFRS
ncbi:uncharacterized protein K452DRAFT_24832 [Aplosporella prunicola CBS 121167]|uniref:Uncharacterized protein n=1 Tax=Aplosporella prunicola CBS 121167 TaxID=1176127 RepID=A0A6A6BHI8_9PEZI|nr:uncharacterized protein K452DRAFT_24832 [Aplosporella prunicola CBS 121167]KAF2142021.1 hypothetical protein K452DRAFT_24832 [Aplosporella prunicola CBS 121167]